MNRYRFHANEDDWRSVVWPPVGPCWCTGYGDGYAVVVAYAPSEDDILRQWPEASDIDVTEDVQIQFSGRFPKPDWWEVDAETMAPDTYTGGNFNGVTEGEK